MNKWPLLIFRKKLIINLTVTLFFLVICQLISFGQTQKSSFTKENLDTNLIVFKAKVLTLSRYGTEDSSSVLNSVLSQEAETVPTIFSDYIVINIINNQNQPVKVKNNKGREVNRFCGENTTCNFVIIYSCITYRFYLIKGFDICEVKELDSEIKNQSILKSLHTPSLIYDLLNDEICKKTGIDIICMLNEKKRKNRLPCYNICNQCTKDIKLY